MNRALWFFALIWPLSAVAQIRLIEEPQSQTVFAGTGQTVCVELRNVGDALVEKDVELRLFQISVGSVVPIRASRPWKRIRMLPHQTILENVPVDFPAIRAASRFRIELSGVGSMTVIAYPPDLLKRLDQLAGDLPLALFDPDRHLKPALKQANVHVADFETDPTDSKLAIVWSNDRNLPEAVKSRVTRGMSAVWIRSSVVPTSYAVHLGNGVVVLTPPCLLNDLADSPSSQLTLIRDAELALQPELLRLPSDNQAE